MSTVLALLTMLILALINHFTDDRRTSNRRGASAGETTAQRAS